MAFQYFLYNADYDNTIVDKGDSSFSPNPPLYETYLDFTIPDLQPIYFYKVVKGVNDAIVVNDQNNIDAYLSSESLIPDSYANVTYGEFNQVVNAVADLSATVITGVTNLGGGDGQLYSGVINGSIGLKSISGGTNVTITTDDGYVGISACDPLRVAWTGSTACGIGTYVGVNTICSNPHLTFDGKKLFVDGDVNVVGMVSSAVVCATTSSSTPVFYITSPPPSGSVQRPTLFWNKNSCVVEAYLLTGGSSNYHYKEIMTPSTTTSKTCVKYLGYTANTFQDGIYQVDLSSLYGNLTSNASSYFAFKINGSLMGGNMSGRMGLSSWNIPVSMSKDIKLTEGVHCFDVYYWAGSGTACISFATIRVKLIG